MRFSHRLIKDNDTALGISRTNRNDWAKSVEDTVRALAPLPISYDIDCSQDTYFSEFTYTEFLGGILISTQNIEVNCKIRKEACVLPASKSHLEHMSKITSDKYALQDTDLELPKHVGFMVGHNMFDLVSPEVVCRTAFENKNFMLKLHPLTNKEYAGKIAKLIGWDRIIPAHVSGVRLVEECEVAYVTTATELCALAVAKEKKISNISSFFHEAGGAYYSINTFLFKSENPAETLNNLVDCPFSGIIFPWMDDVEDRIKSFYGAALEVRNMLAPVASPNLLRKIPTE